MREAHPTDGWQVDANIENNILFRQAQSTEEREEVANTCSVDLNIQTPIIIEDINNGVDEAYGAAPTRLYVVGTDGLVTYHGRVGPHFLDFDEWDQAIKDTIAS